MAPLSPSSAESALLISVAIDD
jgi:PXA domain